MLNQLKPNSIKLIVGACIAAFSGLSSAALTVTSVVGGVPSGVKYVNLDTLDLGSTGGTSNNVQVDLSGNAAVVQSSTPYVHAAPYLSNSNGTLFGDVTVSGPDTTRYVATQAGGTVSFTFNTPALYFGLLWGSVDAFNTLTFYDANGNSVGTVNGLDVSKSANGDQGALGTYYVNIESTQSFSKVVMSGAYFEADNIAYSETIPVPEASTYAMLLAGLGVLGVVSRRRKAA